MSILLWSAPFQNVLQGRVGTLAISIVTGWRLHPGAKTVSTNSESEKNNGGRLVGAQVIFRHGARTPVYLIKAAPGALPEASWDAAMTTDVAHTLAPFTLHDLDGRPTGADVEETMRVLAMSQLPGGALKGQLTRRGQEDMFEFGRRLRQRYVADLGLAPAVFDPQRVYCRSTRYPRNIASARCVLAGIFGLGPEPARIHVATFLTETLSPNRFSCRWVMDAVDKFTPVDFPPGLQALRERAVQLLGPDTLFQDKTMPDGSVRPTIARLHAVRDELVCRTYHGYPLPDNIRPFVDDCDRLCSYEMAENVLGPQRLWRSGGLKAGTGPLLQLILDNLTAHLAAGPSCQRLHLYATHDDAIIALLLAMDLFDGDWPSFGANIGIELFETGEGSHVVQLRYCEKVIARLPLSEFRARIEEFATTPEEYHDLCRRGIAP